MNFLIRFVPLLMVALLINSNAWADNYQVTKKMFIKAGAGKMFSTAYGYAMFPNIGKGGFGVGGAYGKGRVYRKGEYIGDSSLIQVSIGFQLGGVGYSQVVFLQDKRALDEFTSGNFEFGAEAQATVITVTAEALASTGGSSVTASGNKNNAQIGATGFTKGMAIFQITKGGMMYEASVGGQKFSYTKR